MSSDGYVIITHYQKVIKKARNDEAKLLHCIGKLFDLPITIEHLQRTGVGKTVNSLRKYNGEVGTAAKNLVSKWKAMVANGETSEKHDGHTGDEFVKNSNKVKSLDLSPMNDVANNKQPVSDSKSTQSDSHVNERRNSHHRSKETNTSSHSPSATRKTGTHSEENNKDSGKKRKSRHVDNEIMSDAHPKTKKAKILTDTGIDSSMGASFSDALGMCSIVTKKKHKKSQINAMETGAHEEIYERKATNNNVVIVPEALKILPQSKLDEPLKLPLSAPVLKITGNYKPAPINQNVMNCIYPSKSTEKAAFNVDALSIGISSKTMRTKVYSGVKTGALLSVPSLFDICIRILQKNIDALEYTGGVPFDVLRPVLERTTPQQLLSIEDYNAYLLEDTDILWQQHVGRHFRGENRREGETWREMFLRCENEKEHRLDILTKSIKISQKQSALPVRKTRLAYVDNVVKPPRNVKRKQELYGTNDKLIASPAARVAALSSASHNTVKAGDPRLKISRDVLPSAGSNQFRPKKAPLMAKTLQFIKKRYKK